MRFHPDVLACHAQFGGDLEDMQRRYDAAPSPEKAAPIPALLPCPFCGVDGSIEEGFPGHFMAICMSCYCNVGENVEPTTGAAKHMFESADEAAEAWNRRADRETRPSFPYSREERIREDERDRLYEEFTSAFTEEVYQIRGAAMWAGEVLRRKGAMFPAERARARQGGNNG